MSDVIPFAPADQETNPALVRFLEALLARAKSGELLGVAVVGTLTGREFTTGYSVIAGTDDRVRLLGAFEFLKARLVAEAPEGELR